jgi:hypothetical protein
MEQRTTLPRHTTRRRDGIRARNESRCATILEAPSELPLDDLPWHDAHPAIDAGVIDTLVYMRDVEGFTDRYLVGLAAHKTTLGDRLIGPFLRKWRAEEAGHTAAIERFLGWYARDHNVVIPPRQPPPPATAAWHERVLSRIGGPFGATVAAAHMTWGAANELLTVNGYRLLADRCGHPLLAEMLRRIAAQESRHFSFYLLQAEWRLASSRGIQKVLRRVLERSWTPVGIGEGYKTQEEFGRVLAYLGDGPEGDTLLTRMDNRFAALPGFGDLRIFTAAADAIAA